MNLTSRIQSQQFQLRCNRICGHFGIGCCSSTATAIKIGIELEIVQSLGLIIYDCIHWTYYMFLAKKWIFSQFLSATIGPSVARVSAPRTTPSLKIIPTIVVPVLIAFGSLKPFFISISLLNIEIKHKKKSNSVCGLRLRFPMKWQCTNNFWFSKLNIPSTILEIKSRLSIVGKYFAIFQNIISRSRCHFTNWSTFY